ncbi:MAG: transposase, partial [Acidobacteria bacterium]|nr:transposase [Acidobacteriota bacterium]
MRKIKEVLRLRLELGLGQRQIARSCGIGLSTVHDYLERAVAAGIGWPLPEDLGEEELEGKLFGKAQVEVRGVQRPQPDWKALHEQLQHRHLTLQLLWQEYRQAHPEGYGYSCFCERYQQWRPPGCGAATGTQSGRKNVCGPAPLAHVEALRGQGDS